MWGQGAGAREQPPSGPAPGSAGPAPLRRHWRWHAGACAGLAVLALVQSGQWDGDWGSRTYVGPDVAICAWLQTTVSGNLLRHPWRLFEGNVYYPLPDPVVYANAQLGPALLVTPLRLFTPNPALLNNAGTLLSFLAASYGCFLLAWWLWGDPGAALVPAIAIPYSAHQIHHITHLNMVAIFGFPFFLLGALLLLERPRLPAALLAGAAFGVQALSCGYYAVAVAGLGIVVGAWGLPRMRSGRAWACVALAVGLAALLCAPYLLAFRGATLGAWPEGGEIPLRLPRDLFRSDAWLWRGVLPERGDSAFFGFGAGSLALIGVWRVRGRGHAGLLALVAACFLVLSLGSRVELFGLSLSLPYGWLQDAVPLLRAGRHPVSLVVVAVLALGLLAALGARSLRLTSTPLRLALLLAVVVAEVLTLPIERRSRGDQLPAAYSAVAELKPAGAIVELPFDRPEQQWWAALHGLRTTNGNLPHAPAEWLTLTQWIKEDWKAEPPRDVSDRRSVLYLQARFPVRYLVAHPGTHGAWIRNLEATPGVFRLVRQSSDSARIYRVSRGGAGKRLRRDFRSEDLGAGLWLVARGPAGHRLVVEEDGEERARLPLADQAARTHVAMAASGYGRLVSVVLRAEPEARFELLEIEPATTPGR